MSQTTPEENKKFVLEAFDKPLNQPDYAAAEPYWSRHSRSSIVPTLHQVARVCSPDQVATAHMKYEAGLVVAEEITSFCTGASLTSSGPRTGSLPISFAFRTGILAEHWNVLQDEATEEQSENKSQRLGTPPLG